jgi:hypothetical protein
MTFQATVKVNSPPYFEPALATNVEVEMTLKSAVWNYKLPQIKDDDGDTVSLSINFGTASFVQQPDDTTISIPDTSKNLAPGSYSITF